jgi:hypothetical protein
MTAGDHHGDFGDFGFWMVKHDVMHQNHEKFKFQASVVLDPPWESHLSCCYTPCMPFSFIQKQSIY